MSKTASKLLFVVVMALCAGCASRYDVIAAMHRGGYDEVLENTENINDFPERDRTLILNYRAQAKLGLGYHLSARDDFLRSWNIMNTGAGGGHAAAYVIAEDNKYYMGDPYERVFNSYYLGLLYYMLNAPEDAMASFTNALFADTGDFKLNEYAADFVPAMVMRTRVYLDRGAKLDAQDQLKALNALPKNERNFDPACPWFNIDDQLNTNTLFFVELGDGPFMTAEGRHGQTRVIHPSRYPEAYAEIYVDGKTLGRTYKVADSFFQAVTRGGRAMDEVLKGKAIAKDVTTVVGAVGVGVGVSMMENGDSTAGAITAGVGALVLLAGLLLNPEADVRSNVLLPGEVHLMQAQLPPGPHDVELRVFDKDGRELRRMRQEGLDLNVPQKGDAVMLLRSQPRYKIPLQEADRLADPYARHKTIR
ncbi:MAG: hypothetical protein IT462_02765 [Planctomycetes bacterium]|nr:hypothetical protein [Planctomycetota bacterium]